VPIRGQVAPNPWVWRIKHLHEFLASFVPPNQAPPASPALPVGTAVLTGNETAREVYSFSPAVAPPRQLGEALAQPAPVVAGGEGHGGGDIEAAEDEVVSPEPAQPAAGKLADVEPPWASFVVPSFLVPCGAGQAAHVSFAHSPVQEYRTSPVRCLCSSCASQHKTAWTAAAWRAPSWRLWQHTRHPSPRLRSISASLRPQPCSCVRLHVPELSDCRD
jgi:hypothetical protein